MIFHLVINSFFVFLLLASVVELSLFIFKIKNARTRYICRLLPILKIPVDLFVFGIFGESLFLNLNPFSCEIYLNNSITALFNLPPGTPIPQYIASKLQPIYLNLFAISVVAISALLFSYKCARLVASQIYLRKVLSLSIPCHRLISSHRIHSELQRLNGIVLTCDQVQTPFAAGRRKILLPTALVNHFSQDEFEAVIAHELEHLKWKDPILRFISSVICSICWWIPTGWWSKRLEADQELASDLGIPKYGIDGSSLGSAFLKAIHQERVATLKSAAICPFVSPKSTHVKRLENMLNLNKPLKEHTLISTFGAALCCMAFLCFWMC